MADKEIVLHQLICPEDKCTCPKRGGKLLGKVRCTKADSLLVETVCPNAKSKPLYFCFGPNPPEPPK